MAPLIELTYYVWSGIKPHALTHSPKQWTTNHSHSFNPRGPLKQWLLRTYVEVCMDFFYLLVCNCGLCSLRRSREQEEKSRGELRDDVEHDELDAGNPFRPIDDKLAAVEVIMLHPL